MPETGPGSRKRSGPFLMRRVAGRVQISFGARFRLVTRIFPASASARIVWMIPRAGLTGETEFGGRLR